ncbi:MAG: CDP-glycerol glycerophosphotransferase family protein [bacterium]|nr:CDP-glycerol glycerophosphotransferase family protein [bacterium]
MQTIFITISRGSLIRNFFHTGIVTKLLDKGYRVVVLTPNYEDQNLFAKYAHPNLVLKPLHPHRIRCERFMVEVLKGAVFNRTVHFLWRYRLAGTDPRRMLYIPRLFLIAPLRLVPGFKRFIQWVDRMFNPQTEHDYLFEQYKPQLAFVTAVNSYMDSSVTKGARRFSVPTVGMPKSWDNLSKILFNAPTDYLIVWSKFMRRQAMRYQGYSSERIIITGAPQFDIYRIREYLLSREEFCRQFNFDAGKKIILHGSCGGGVGINMEADYPEMVQEWIDSGELTDVQVLIRPHVGYKDEAEKFERVSRLSNIALDRSDKQDSRLLDRWDPSFNHIKHLYNSLYHADVCVNLGSTLTLDSIACGTPVINIAFDKDDNVAYRDSVKRLYNTDYIMELMKLGGTWMVKSRQEFLTALKAVFKYGKKKDTSTIVDQFMCCNDGKAAERIVNTLISVMAEDK